MSNLSSEIAAGDASVPSESELLSIAAAHLMQNYRQPPMVLQRAQGAEMWDTQGRRYIDLCAGVAVSALGHNHPAIAQVLARQASFIHGSNYFFNVENILCARDLCQRARMDRAFFCNSGTEAVEAAIKIVRRHHFNHGQTDRFEIIAFDKSFHGRTLGALAATGNAEYRQGFGPPLEGFHHVPYGDLEATSRLMGPRIAAIIVEPIQGEGGVLPAPPGFLAGLRDLTKRHGALLIADEIQTGVGRTGTFLGIEHDGVTADVVTLAKGLGGGVPIGAMLATNDVAKALTPGTHGSTFGGNPLASSVARTVLATIEREGLLAHASALGAHLTTQLSAMALEFPSVCKGARGRGLLQGLILQPAFKPRDVLGRLLEAGVLLTAAGSDVVRFTPPLVITRALLDEGLAKVRRALTTLAP